MLEKLFRLLQTSWFIALLALLVRIAWILYKISVIPKEVLATAPFENEVGNVAAALAGGHGFCCLFRQPTGPTAWLSPTYPLLIAAIFKIFGSFTFSSFCASVLLNSLFSALTCLPLYHAAVRVAGKFTAFLAGWFWALSPIAIILPYAWIWDSSLSAFLGSVILWATLGLPDRPDLRGFTLYGLLWGISLLTNPALGALLPFLLIWILLRFRASNPQRLRYALVCAVVIVLTCLPWTLRNYMQFHRFVPFRSNFAYEFWSGNNEIFDPESRELNRITRYEQTRLYAHLGETAFLDQKWQAARHFVGAHPVLYANLCARRFVATWLGTDSPVHDFLNADSAMARFLLLWNAVCSVLIVAGLARLYRERRAFFVPLAVFPFIFPITFYLAHTSLRHRHPCDPALLLLAAIALTGCGRQMRS
jgi:4-amino-4-deoxy-L-arabinose transferase-like glycosyltransferase